MSTQKNFCLTVNARGRQHYKERLPSLHVAQLGPRSTPAYTSRSWARAVCPPTRRAPTWMGGRAE